MIDKYIHVNEHYMTIEMVTPSEGEFKGCEVGGEKVFSVSGGDWYADRVYFKTPISDEPPKEIVVVFKRKEEVSEE